MSRECTVSVLDVAGALFKLRASTCLEDGLVPEHSADECCPGTRRRGGEVVMVTPAGADGKVNRTVLAAAHLAGIREVYRIGGAQAIAALAFGTETIPKVDVISGPGNLYVTLAKKFVYGHVGIDSLAGPSEVLVIADASADVKQVATDLLAQAEHDPLAAAILLTTSPSLAEAIPAELEQQLQGHPRETICKDSRSIGGWWLSATTSKPAHH